MLDKEVSVIIPTYNRSRVLEKTVPSYIQEITLEVIIVDDGSCDCTKETVKKLKEKYKIVKYIDLKKHRGLPFAKNIGVKKSSGKYVFFGDDDSILYPGTLCKLKDAIENYPADIAGVNGSYATEMQQIKNIEGYIEENFTQPFNTNCIVDFNEGKFNFNYKITEIVEGLYTMSPFMIKSEMAKSMKFHSGYIGNAAREDMDYLIRQAKEGKKMVYVPDTYEINLPLDYVKGGGSHDMKQWKYCIYAIRNNNYFLDRHYSYLKEKGFISVSKWQAKKNFCIRNLESLWQKWKRDFFNM